MTEGTDEDRGADTDAGDDADADGSPYGDVDAALDEAFPGRTVESVTTVHAGNRKRTVVARFGDGRAPATAVVQTAPAGSGLRTEAALARSVAARTDVPVPEVLGGGVVPGHGRAFVVTEHAAGEDLHARFVALAPARRTAVAREFGRYLAGLHAAFAFEGYGPVGLRGPAGWEAVLDDPDPGSALAVGGRRETTGGIPEASDDWADWFLRYATAGVDALPAGFDDLRPRLRAELADERPRLPASPPSTLYPWDLRPGNALVDDGRVTAVVDWGQPLAADPALSLAKVEHLVCDWYLDDDGSLATAVRAGYRERRPLPSVPSVYRLPRSSARRSTVRAS
ncbi:phosphotransferase family protein [Halobaculum litoreum]|uniref:Phosphotransferase family protein n=1 Tax=Halobaculum litoreum TaxID=3031998 RepID=A0ABD5XP67_9EURY